MVAENKRFIEQISIYGLNGLVVIVGFGGMLGRTFRVSAKSRHSHSNSNFLQNYFMQRKVSSIGYINKKLIMLMYSHQNNNENFQLCAGSSYSRRMLDMKTFQIREECYTPGRCIPGHNESRRDFITRLKCATRAEVINKWDTVDLLKNCSNQQ